MDVDKRKSIIGLVEAGFLVVRGLVGVDREVRVFGDNDGRRGCCRSGGGCTLPFLKKFLVPDIVEDVLHVAEHDERDGEERSGEQTREAQARE